MSNLQIFNFESQEVRFVGTSEDPWWVASDVCSILELANVSKALQRLDDNEKRDDITISNVVGKNQAVWAINESGLYSLVLTSRKPQAKRFKKWITSEVIPAIRKTGKYELATKPPEQTPLTPIQVIAAIAAQLADQEQKNKELETRLEAIEAEQDRFSTPCGHKYTIMGYANLQNLQISAQVAAAMGRKAALACKNQGLTVEKIHDPRFGKVGLYPESVLIQVFSESSITTITKA